MDPQAIEILMGIKQDIGEVKAGVSNLEKHTTSVSAKAGEIRAELTAHIAQEGAHGVAIKEKAGVSMREGVLALCAILGTGAAVATWYQSRQLLQPRDGYYDAREGRWERSRGRSQVQDSPATQPAFPAPLQAASGHQERPR